MKYPMGKRIRSIPSPSIEARKKLFKSKCDLTNVKAILATETEKVRIPTAIVKVKSQSRTNPKLRIKFIPKPANSNTYRQSTGNH